MLLYFIYYIWDIKKKHFKHICSVLWDLVCVTFFSLLSSYFISRCCCYLHINYEQILLLFFSHCEQILLCPPVIMNRFCCYVPEIVNRFCCYIPVIVNRFCCYISVNVKRFCCYYLALG